MTVDDLINDLKYGELSAHGIFALDPLSNKNREKLIAVINMGLLTLYTRFPLLTKELTLKQLNTVTKYKLSSDFARSEGGSVIYIIDTEDDPFTDDVIRIEAVYDDIACECVLNNTSDCNVILTPSMDTLEIPYPIDGVYLSVVYRAKHPYVSDNKPDILLPEHLKPVLLNYIAHRIYSGVAAQDGMALAQAFYQKYMMLSNELNQDGMVNKADGEYFEQFVKGGWI